MEITGIKCNTKGCGNRVFLEDAESAQWTTEIMTSPGSGLRLKVHRCPTCIAKVIANLDTDQVEKLDSGQQRVINPDHVDPALERMMHEEDDRKSGVPIRDWSAPTGDPFVRGGIVPAGGNGIGALIPGPAPSIGPEPAATGPMPIVRTEVGNVQQPRGRQGRKRRTGGSQAAITTAITTAFLFFVSVTHMR